ncbi:2Fe-2S iron-sulfur cluster-binding protein [Massilia sp. P8910]|uniref:2Fe-2S iron-sulfur cluster-binding protein n=1 Tax=Massilia antarctica TaxID=2765360 RepID=UPI001E358696|nr:2Fe-2S iron-sulfur cluster-binding protein [Massilia antarctica]MCE3605354.1 2Fe-2S iron-sulfur cluster-binding protein [Massilia antarctica]
MSHPYYDLAFTPAVRALQQRAGSRSSYAAMGLRSDGDPRLGHAEAAFLQAADHFFMASVGETGWPYVQHRGGATGFLKVLDSGTIGFADFGGNRQFISTANLSRDGRVSLFVMDWVNKQRLKLMGRVRVLDPAAEPELARRLRTEDYPEPGERLFVIEVAGFDWNCPQHITQRYRRAHVDEALAGLRATITRLQGEVAARRAPEPAARGQGELGLYIESVRMVSPRVRAYRLAMRDGRAFPALAPGAHLVVPVRLDSGRIEQRQYSLMPVAGRADMADIAVQAAQGGRGGSQAIHAQWQPGTELDVPLPLNHFELHADARPAVLIAGGIGITPLRAMALARRALGWPFSLHLAARLPAEAPFARDLRDELGEQFACYFSAEGTRMDIEALLRAAPDEALVYVCGPVALIEAAEAAAAQLGMLARLCSERFSAAQPGPDARPLRLHLARSGKSIDVAAGVSLLEAVEAAGIDLPSSCRTGSCGGCKVKCVAGQPQHHDNALSAAERADHLCLCVSRAFSAELTLDL